MIGLEHEDFITKVMEFVFLNLYFFKNFYNYIK